jgi:hypothetical protein
MNGMQVKRHRKPDAARGALGEAPMHEFGLCFAVRRFTLSPMRKGTHVVSAWLWDLLPVRRPAPASSSPAATQRGEEARSQYDKLVRVMKQRHSVRVRRWRSTHSGCAWQVMYADGTIARLIEAPRPRGPVSAAVFLHEVGHHAIGFHRYELRCHEEYKAWEWALAAMEEQGIPVTERVQSLMDRSLRYAVAKAIRRGLKIDKLPRELRSYVTPGKKRGR